MPETTPLIKAALNLRVGAGFDVYERERGKEELPLKQKATVCTPQRVRIVAAFLLFDFGAFNHGQIFILLFFEKRLKIV